MKRVFNSILILLLSYSMTHLSAQVVNVSAPNTVMAEASASFSISGNTFGQAVQLQVSAPSAWDFTTITLLTEPNDGGRPTSTTFTFSGTRSFAIDEQTEFNAFFTADVCVNGNVTGTLRTGIIFDPPVDQDTEFVSVESNATISGSWIFSGIPKQFSSGLSSTNAPDWVVNTSSVTLSSETASSVTASTNLPPGSQFILSFNHQSSCGQNLTATRTITVHPPFQSDPNAPEQKAPVNDQIDVSAQDEESIDIPLHAVYSTDRIRVFPNPLAQGKMLHVSLPHSPGKMATLMIINAHGQTLQSHRLSAEGQTAALQTGELPSGVYYLRQLIGNDISSHSFVIK